MVSINPVEFVPPLLLFGALWGMHHEKAGWGWWLFFGVISAVISLPL